MMRSRSWRFIAPACAALGVALFACSGGDDGGAVDGADGGTPGADGSIGPANGGACATDADCAAKLPATMPANCAEAHCDALAKQCRFQAKDADGDGHRAAKCTAVGAGSIDVGDDCDDADPSFYPGHPKSCSPSLDGGASPDGGAPGTILCQQGQITCGADGTASACTGAVVCTNQACSLGQCKGVCAPGQTQCSGNGVETCQSDGTWGPSISCGSKACVAGTCEGGCAPGQTKCSASPSTPSNNGVETCDATGHWGNPVACTNKTCIAGQCQGVCAPGQTDPASNQPGGACYGQCQSFTRSCDATTGNWGSCSGTPVNPGSCNVNGDPACGGTGCPGGTCSGPTTKGCPECGSVACGSACNTASTCYTNNDMACAGTQCPGQACSGPSNKVCTTCGDTEACGGFCKKTCPGNWGQSGSTCGQASGTVTWTFNSTASTPSISFPLNSTGVSSSQYLMLKPYKFSTGCCNNGATDMIEVYCGSNPNPIAKLDASIWPAGTGTGVIVYLGPVACNAGDVITAKYLNTAGACCCGCTRYLDLVASETIPICQTF